MSNTENPHGAVVEAETEVFKLDLRELLVKAGRPSYRALQRQTNGELSPSTITRALKGAKLPQWSFVERFLTACGVDERRIVEWKSRWSTISRLSDPQLADRPVREQPAAAPAQVRTVHQGCPTCGVAVLDAAVHQNWHDTAAPARRMHAV